MFDRLIDADNLRIGLGANQAGEPVAGVAADAAALVPILLVEHDADRHVEGLQSRARKVVGQLLDAWLMAHRRPGIRGTGFWFGRIFSAVPVYLIEILGQRVVRLQLVIADRPCWRDATVVAQFADSLFAETEQSSAV